MKRKGAHFNRIQSGLRKEKMLNKGLPRIAAGIDGAKQKVIDFASQLLPYIDAQKEKIKSMPSTSLEDNIARMTSFIRGMANFKRTK